MSPTKIAVPGLPNPIRRWILGGTFGERSDVESFRILDRFLELGGDAVETAHSYAEGEAERQVGRWLRRQGDRDRVVLITKLCHPRGNAPVSIVTFDDELDLSLERLGVNALDVVLLHRDPVGVPPREVLETLERRRQAGSLRTYGLCNVRGDRLASYDLAAEHLGVPPLPILSNYYGLARQARSPWPGTVQLDAAGASWLERWQRPLLCWSALAQGWFGHRELPPDFQPVYDTSANRLRRERAELVASHRGVSALQIALAFAFVAPFPVLASVGPRSIDELAHLVEVERLSLTVRERAFLAGEETVA